MSEASSSSFLAPAPARPAIGPIGEPVPRAGAAAPPSPICLLGAHVDLRPLDPAADGAALWACTHGAERERLWYYLFEGPFADRAGFDGWLGRAAASSDPLFFAIVDRRTGEAAGVAAYLRITPAHRVIEVGHILFGPALQSTAAATEAMFLLARHAFDDLGYRRYEWKCNALNAPSRRAADRLGFQFEGVFRQHLIIKGRNRDTAWYSLLDADWPRCRAAIERWLAPANFDAAGRQVRSLAALRDAGGDAPLSG